MRILIFAFAASPNSGSEPGVAWNISLQLCEKGNQVTLLTQTSNRSAIDSYLEKHWLPLKVIYCDTRKQILFGNLGKLGMYLRYLWWQRDAASQVSNDSTLEFDVAHHVTWGNFWLGTGLRFLPYPYLFGPCGYQASHRITKMYFGPSWATEKLRRIALIVLTHTPAFQKSVAKASLCVSANNESYDKLLSITGVQSSIAMADGISTGSNVETEILHARKNLIWIGRFLPRKGVEVLLIAFKLLLENNPHLYLTLVGDGQLKMEMQAFAKDLGISDSTQFLGRIEHQKVFDLIGSHKLVVFPSLRESSGAQILEAASQGVPSVFFDFIGASTWFSENSSYIVATNNLKQSSDLPKLFALAIQNALNANFHEYEKKCRNSLEIAAENTWERKALKIVSYYQSILSKH